jgi:hypothetical protein
MTTANCKYKNELGYYAHSWKIASPNPEKYGRVSPGWCQGCGATKDFQNSDENSQYSSNVHLFTKKDNDATAPLKDNDATAPLNEIA